MDNKNIKKELNELDRNLYSVESSVVNKYIQLNQRKKKWEDSELLFKDYEEKNQTITFNVGGKKFEIDKGVINNYPNTLLYTIINDKDFDITKPIFIPRSPLFFDLILKFYYDRKKFKLDQFNYFDKMQILKEIKYYQLNDYITFDTFFSNKNIVKNFSFLRKFIPRKVTIDSIKLHKSSIAIKNKYELISDLLNPSNTKGICCKVKEYIEIKLTSNTLLNYIQLKGYSGDGWDDSNGKDSLIEYSNDGESWKIFGKIPKSYDAKNVVTIRHKNKKPKIIFAKFIRISNKDSPIGISYIAFD